MRKFFESVNPRLGRALRSRLQKILSEHSAMIANITIGLSSASSALKTSTQCQGSGGKADNDYFRQGEPQRMQHWVRRDDYSANFFQESKGRIVGYNNFREGIPGSKQMPLMTQPLCIPLCVSFVSATRLNCEASNIDLHRRNIG